LPGGRAIQPRRDPYRRVEFAYERQQDTVTLHTPRGLVNRQWLVLSSCRETHRLSDLPWFGTAQACRSAVGDVRPMDFGDCRGVVHSFPFDQHGEYGGAKWLGRIMTLGGRAYELTEQSSSPECTAWRFRPHGERGQGTMTSRVAEGARTTVTSYDYDYAGRSIILLGPSHRSFEHGHEVSNLAFGCGETYSLRHINPQHATIGGADWFPTEQHCRQATSVRPRSRPERRCNGLPASSEASPNDGVRVP
jgi:hypothetical protein